MRWASLLLFLIGQIGWAAECFSVQEDSYPLELVVVTPPNGAGVGQSVLLFFEGNDDSDLIITGLAGTVVNKTTLWLKSEKRYFMTSIGTGAPNFGLFYVANKKLVAWAWQGNFLNGIPSLPGITWSSFSSTTKYTLEEGLTKVPFVANNYYPSAMFKAVGSVGKKAGEGFKVVETKRYLHIVDDKSNTIDDYCEIIGFQSGMLQVWYSPLVWFTSDPEWGPKSTDGTALKKGVRFAVSRKQKVDVYPTLGGGSLNFLGSYDAFGEKTYSKSFLASKSWKDIRDLGLHLNKTCMDQNEYVRLLQKAQREKSPSGRLVETGTLLAVPSADGSIPITPPDYSINGNPPVAGECPDMWQHYSLYKQCFDYTPNVPEGGGNDIRDQLRRGLGNGSYDPTVRRPDGSDQGVNLDADNTPEASAYYDKSGKRLNPKDPNVGDPFAATSFWLNNTAKVWYRYHFIWNPFPDRVYEVKMVPWWDDGEILSQRIDPMAYQESDMTIKLDVTAKAKAWLSGCQSVFNAINQHNAFNALTFTNPMNIEVVKTKSIKKISGEKSDNHSDDVQAISDQIKILYNQYMAGEVAQEDYAAGITNLKAQLDKLQNSSTLSESEDVEYTSSTIIIEVPDPSKTIAKQNIGGIDVVIDFGTNGYDKYIANKNDGVSEFYIGNPLKRGVRHQSGRQFCVEANQDPMTIVTKDLPWAWNRWYLVDGYRRYMVQQTYPVVWLNKYREVIVIGQATLSYEIYRDNDDAIYEYKSSEYESGTRLITGWTRGIIDPNRGDNGVVNNNANIQYAEADTYDKASAQYQTDQKDLDERDPMTFAEKRDATLQIAKMIAVSEGLDITMHLLYDNRKELYAVAKKVEQATGIYKTYKYAYILYKAYKEYTALLDLMKEVRDSTRRLRKNAKLVQKTAGDLWNYYVHELDYSSIRPTNITSILPINKIRNFDYATYATYNDAMDIAVASDRIAKKVEKYVNPLDPFFYAWKWMNRSDKEGKIVMAMASSKNVDLMVEDMNKSLANAGETVTEEPANAWKISAFTESITDAVRNSHFQVANESVMAYWKGLYAVQSDARSWIKLKNFSYSMATNTGKIFYAGQSESGKMAIREKLYNAHTYTDPPGDMFHNGWFEDKEAELNAID